MKDLYVKNGYFFRILHEILSDNMVSVYHFFGPRFDPIGRVQSCSLTILLILLEPT